MINFGVLKNNLKHGLARQAVTNGNFNSWKQGTSGAISDSTPIWLADEWLDYVVKDGGTLPTLTRSRGTLTSGGLAGSFYYSRLTTNGAGLSLGVSSRHYYEYVINNGTRFLCGAGKKITISFYARSSIANKKIGVFCRQNYGSGGSPSTLETNYGTNWTLTSDWVRYEHTIETTTLSGKTFGTDNNDYIEIFFMYIWGTTTDAYVGATTAETYVGSGTIDIAQVQINSGSIALPFFTEQINETSLKTAYAKFHKNGSGQAIPVTTLTPVTYSTVVSSDSSILSLSGSTMNIDSRVKFLHLSMIQSADQVYAYYMQYGSQPLIYMGNLHTTAKQNMSFMGTGVDNTITISVYGSAGTLTGDAVWNWVHITALYV